MKKFKFRLETVLKLRQQHEDEKRRVVNDLLERLNAAQEAALEMNQAILTEGQRLKDAQLEGNIDLTWIGHYRTYVSTMQRAIKAKIEEVAAIQKELILARAQLAQAAREKKVLEKLKERRCQAHQAGIDHAAAEQMNEVATQHFLGARRAEAVAQAV